MPAYDYRCETNGRLYEVSHSMSLTLKTWKELAEVGSFEDKSIPDDTEVTRVLTTGGIVKSSSLKNPAPPCMSGQGCSGKCAI